MKWISIGLGLVGMNAEQAWQLTTGVEIAFRSIEDAIRPWLQRLTLPDSVT
jgi:hypothetical protein